MQCKAIINTLNVEAARLIADKSDTNLKKKKFEELVRKDERLITLHMQSVHVNEWVRQ